MKSLFKRLPALALAVLLMGLAGCGGKKELPLTTIATESGKLVELPTVRVLIDVLGSLDMEQVNRFLNTVPGYKEEFYVEYEFLPDVFEGEIRDQRLRRIRTEILAGKGPDLFICDSTSAVIDTRDLGIEMGDGALFNFPTQAMKNHLFLPLDGYIEKAEFMDWESLNPDIMAAGRNHEGQQILPMTFDCGAVCYDPSAGDAPKKPPETRQEMLDSGCKPLKLAATSIWGLEGSLLDIFPQVEDWNEEVPAFTEDELLGRALEYWGSCQEDWDLGADNGRFGGPGAVSESISVFVNGWLRSNEGVMVPIYNSGGGVTATVKVYAAINRNANYPGYAFRVLDKLLSKEEMGERRIYGNILGLAVHTGADGGDIVPVEGALKPELQDNLRGILEKVNNVRFISDLDKEMIRTLVPLCRDESATEKDIEKAVHKVYFTMKMMLAES